MNSLQTILGSRIATSAEINGLYVPANCLTEYLKAYSEPAVFAAEGCGIYNMGLGGSMVKIKIGKKYFTILSQHQFARGGFDFEQLSLFNFDTNRMATTEKAIFPIETEDNSGNLDCVLCEFTGPVLQGSISKHGWYDIAFDLSFEDTRSAICVFAIGYPGYRNEIDYDDLNYAIGPNAVIGEESPPFLSNRLSFKPINKLNYDPKGMSGSPVFGLHLSKLHLKVFLAGIVTEASRDQFHFLPLNRLHGFFDRALSKH